MYTRHEVSSGGTVEPHLKTSSILRPLNSNPTQYFHLKLETTIWPVPWVVGPKGYIVISLLAK